MSKRKTKRVDYSKFDGETEDSDDDFQIQASPVKKSKKANQQGRKHTEKEIENKTKGRKTRTSNAEIDFQKSLLKATELSKTVTNSNTNDCIQIDDSDEEEVLNIIKKKPSNVQKTNVFASDNEEESEIEESSLPPTLSVDVKPLVISSHLSSSDECPPTLPIGVQQHNTSNQYSLPHKNTTKQIKDQQYSVQQERVEGQQERVESQYENFENKKIKVKESCDEENLVNEQRVSKTRRKKPLRRASSNIHVEEKLPDVVENTIVQKSFINKTPVQRTVNPNVVSNKSITPGRLRLGLSRNLRVTKPLHVSVNPIVTPLNR